MIMTMAYLNQAKQAKTGFWMAAVLLATAFCCARADDQIITPIASWSFEKIVANSTPDNMDHHPGVVHGNPRQASGVEGKSMVLDGEDDYVSVSDSAALSFTEATFSLSVWVNSYGLNRGQQMVLAKNVYVHDQREWGLMVDDDTRFKFYAWQGGWQTVGSQTTPRPGQWYHLAAIVNHGHVRLFVNGTLEGEARLGPSLPDTAAPLTIGGVNDGGRLRQMWYGALDEVCLYDEVLSPVQVRAAAERQTTPHEVPTLPEPYVLWTGGEMPKSADITVLRGVEFSVIKPHEPDVDGGNWLLGVALAWHKGKLYASYGFNTGSENTATESMVAVATWALRTVKCPSYHAGDWRVFRRDLPKRLPSVST